MSGQRNVGQKRGRSKHGKAKGRGKPGSGPPQHGTKPFSGRPTVADIVSDDLTQLSQKTWGSGVADTFDAALVQRLWREELAAQQATRIVLLELSFYLEHYIWPHWSADTTTLEHDLSIMTMVNEKCRENLDAWRAFHSDDARFAAFLRHTLSLEWVHQEGQTQATSLVYIQYLINVFASLADPVIRRGAAAVTFFPMWNTLPEEAVLAALADAPTALRKAFAHNRKKQARMNAKELANQRDFFPGVVSDFLTLIESFDGEEADGDDSSVTVPRQTQLYAERFMEWMIDLMGQVGTRRFVKLVLDLGHFLVRCRLSRFHGLASSALFRKLVNMLHFYMGFEVDDFTGKAMSQKEMQVRHSERITRLQRTLFTNFESARSFALTNIGTMEKPDVLRRNLGYFEHADLVRLCNELHLVSTADASRSKDFLVEVLVQHHQGRVSRIDEINAMPVYPTETLLFDTDQIPTGMYRGREVLALPKLSVQFLTYYDYLLRNWTLFRLEAAYAIRSDVQDVVRRLRPKAHHSGKVKLQGWSRMALPIQSFEVTRVISPNVGETKPARVDAELTISLSAFEGKMREEWESIRRFDVLFLLRVEEPDAAAVAGGDGSQKKQGGQRRGKAYQTATDVSTFCDRFGLRSVRGAEVWEVRDTKGNRIDEHSDQRRIQGDTRTFLLKLDPAQYQADLEAESPAHERGAPPLLRTVKLYERMNVVMRRRAKENNFAAVLHTIRALMNHYAQIVPPWLHDVFLGWKPAGAVAQTRLRHIDMADTFVDADHVQASFPGAAPVKLEPPQAEPWDKRRHAAQRAGVAAAASAASDVQPPFRLTFPEDAADEHRASGASIVAQAYVPPNPGPYPRDAPLLNRVRFTPRQVEAIRSGVNEGLSIIVGPPGTGKTDVAVQVVNVLYHQFPGQRTLVVTHSNQALNQIFAKLMALDVDQAHLVRLGHGAGSLGTVQDMSRSGRVNHMLSRRLHLLERVSRLAAVLGVPGDVGYTCETAAHFHLQHVQARWEVFAAAWAHLPTHERTAAWLVRHFPFGGYFTDAPQPLFHAEDAAEANFAVAEGCYRHIARLFTDLAECRPFEVLRNSYDRANYLVTSQARIVAMTCTHAALTRSNLVELGFKYDNLLMEEAGQVLEIETFIPMLLQEHKRADQGCRLKRVVLIGDHNQLPPVVQNAAFQRYAHLDQSLFARFIRMGVPHIQLDAQGRARPSLAKLFAWRYPGLRNLDAVVSGPAFATANAGMRWDYQLVDVADYMGRGEQAPQPHFYQNLGEAEYVVATYQFLRLMGYPAERISILTTYNGQKHLIRDVVRKRCAWNPALFGQPRDVCTVDKFQGQQNDIILLSLVRTATVGHLRDVRRLIVAMSRARLGLYVFARKSLFANCYELTNVFTQLLARPTQLQVVRGEAWPGARALDDAPSDASSVITLQDVAHMGQLVYSLTQERMAGGAGASAASVPPANAVAPASVDTHAAAAPVAAVATDAVDKGRSSHGKASHKRVRVASSGKGDDEHALVTARSQVATLRDAAAFLTAEGDSAAAAAAEAAVASPSATGAKQKKAAAAKEKKQKAAAAKEKKQKAAAAKEKKQKAAAAKEKKQKAAAAKEKKGAKAQRGGKRAREREEKSDATMVRARTQAATLAEGKRFLEHEGMDTGSDGDADDAQAGQEEEEEPTLQRARTQMETLAEGKRFLEHEGVEVDADVVEAVAAEEERKVEAAAAAAAAKEANTTPEEDQAVLDGIGDLRVADLKKELSKRDVGFPKRARKAKLTKLLESTLRARLQA